MRCSRQNRDTKEPPTLSRLINPRPAAKNGPALNPEGSGGVRQRWGGPARVRRSKELADRNGEQPRGRRTFQTILIHQRA